MDIKHVLSRNPMLPAYLPLHLPGSRDDDTGHLDGAPGRSRRGRPPRRRFRLRQRVPPPPGPPRALRPGRPHRHLRRVDGLHRRRRLPARRTVAVRRLGHGRGRGVGVTAVLVGPGRRVARVHPGRRGAGRPLPAGLPCQLLRGGCLRPLVRAPAAHRGGVGGGEHGPGGRRGPTATCSTPWSSIRPPPPEAPPRRSATSGSGPRRPTAPTRGSPPNPVRWASTTASSWSASTCCAAARASLRPTTSDRPTGTSSHHRPAGPSAGSGWPVTPEPATGTEQWPTPSPDPTGAHGHPDPPHHRRAPHPGRPAGGHGGRRPRRAVVAPPRSSRPSTSTTTGAAACSTTSPACPSTTRPGPSAPSSRPTPATSCGPPAPTCWWSWGPAPATSPGSCSTPCGDSGRLGAYVPLDVSDTTLWEAATSLSECYPGLPVRAVVGDFHHHLDCLDAPERRLIAFLGGTIGNFHPAQRAAFLAGLVDVMRPGDRFLLGTDVIKDRGRLHRRLRRLGRGHRRVQPERAPRAQPRARGRLRSRTGSPTWPGGTRPTTASRCGCGPRRELRPHRRPRTRHHLRGRRGDADRDQHQVLARRAAATNSRPAGWWSTRRGPRRRRRVRADPGPPALTPGRPSGRTPTREHAGAHRGCTVHDHESDMERNRPGRERRHRGRRREPLLPGGRRPRRVLRTQRHPDGVPMEGHGQLPHGGGGR